MEKIVVISFLFLIVKNINGYPKDLVDKFEQNEREKWRAREEEFKYYSQTVRRKHAIVTNFMNLSESNEMISRFTHKTQITTTDFASRKLDETTSGFESIKCNHSRQCQTGLLCINGVCTADTLQSVQQYKKLFGEKGSLGDICLFDSDCKDTLRCRFGKCKTKNSKGDFCSSYLECVNPLVCRNFKCQSEGLNGESCSFTSECSDSLSCRNGICESFSESGSSSASEIATGVCIAVGLIVVAAFAAIIKRACRNRDRHYVQTFNATTVSSYGRTTANQIVNPIANPTVNLTANPIPNPPAHCQTCEQPSEIRYPDSNLPTYDEAVGTAKK